MLLFNIFKAMLVVLLVTVLKILQASPQLPPVIPPFIQPPAKKTIHIGALFVANDTRYTPWVGYNGSAGALLVAIDKIKEMHLLDDFDFNITVKFDNCIEKEAVGLAFELISTYNVDIIFGPTCNVPAIAVGVMAAYYNLPHYIWGFTTANELAYVPRFPTVIILTPNYFTLSLALLSVMDHFNWNQFAFIYTSSEDPQKCPIFLTDVQKAVDKSPNITISYQAQFKDSTVDMPQILQEVKSKARIIVLCLSLPENKRSLMLRANELDMLGDDYVYIFADLGTRGYRIPSQNTTYVWEDQSDNPDGMDLIAHKAFHKAFILSDVAENNETSQVYENFAINVSKKMKEAPFFCGDACNIDNGWKMAESASQLYDAFIIWATMVNKSLAENVSYRNGAWMFDRTAGTYEGLMSNVTIAWDGARIPDFSFSGLNNDLYPQTLGIIRMDNRGENATFTPLYDLYNEDSIIWSGGKRPNTVPVCGFEGTSCPQPFMKTFGIYVIAAVCVAFFLVFIIILIIFYAIRTRNKERERQDALWKIPICELQRVQHKVTSQSFVSHVSDSRVIEGKAETARMCYFYYVKDSLMGFKHKVALRYEEKVNEEFRKMRQIEHDNLNRFFGITMDSALTYSLWRFCSRGTLQDVITKGSLPMDSVFIHSIMMDIASGLLYIHDSFLACHGRLTSQVCLVDDRWQVKISYYGLTYIKDVEHRLDEELLWTAPEILRGETNSKGTPEGDIYSFAIIASELITKKTAWDLDNRKENIKDIISLVKKTSMDPFRPEIEITEGMDIIPSLVHMIRECWAETPRHRHPMKQVKTILASMLRGNKKNLMDHVMNTLENYASSLETEVQERMKELMEEKRKCDLLLYRMLPKQVAERLKVGQAVQPESYDSVTIFFSDVVSFTTLASKCTPMQVVTLLNELYTVFDGTIAKHDVYKVETIGDGYLCVSGLPNRNGLEHIKEICDLSLELISNLKSFRVPHLPKENINIRVGIHTGSVVAGVVGLTMPRYCLFGDTVNTASRMESNGKASHIHLSLDAHNLLNATHSGYRTESRGEVIIKGKGVMHTFWLFARGSEIDIEEVDSNMTVDLIGAPQLHLRFGPNNYQTDGSLK